MPDNINAIVEKLTKGIQLSSSEETALSKYIYQQIAKHPMVNKSNATQLNLSLEDLIQEAAMYIWRRLPKYDSKRAQVSTFISMMVEQHLNYELRTEERKRLNMISIFDEIKNAIDQEGNSLTFEDIIKEEGLTADEKAKIEMLMEKFKEKVAPRHPYALEILEKKMEGMDDREIILEEEERAKKANEKPHYSLITLRRIKDHTFRPTFLEVFKGE